MKQITNGTILNGVRFDSKTKNILKKIKELGYEFTVKMPEKVDTKYLSLDRLSFVFRKEVQTENDTFDGEFDTYLHAVTISANIRDIADADQYDIVRNNCAYGYDGTIYILDRYSLAIRFAEVKLFFEFVDAFCTYLKED